MSSAFDTPASIGSEFAELKRRIRVLETAARVPQVTSLGADGIQFANNTGVITLSGPGSQESDGSAGIDFLVNTGPTGYITLVYGGFCWSGGGIYDAMMEPYVYRGVELLGTLNFPHIGTTRADGEYVSSAGREKFEPNETLNIVYMFKKLGAPDYDANFASPWLLCIPS